MKLFGAVLIIVGIALLGIVIYNFVKSSNKTLSPVPEDNGIKVILISPTP